MRLTELDPRWLEESGRKVGFVFRCPTKRDVWQTCMLEAGRRQFVCDACRPTCQEWCCPHSQMGLAVRAGAISNDDDCHNIQAAKWDVAWRVHGALDFSVLTVTPSIDGSPGGLWHGFITEGQIR